MEQAPFVSIIIVNYNGEHLIERCLSSVINTNYPNYEIIVVDNNSTDNSITIVREKFSSCRVIQLKENMGFAIANNIGAKVAKGEYFVFLNNDTYVTADWIRELVFVMKKDDSIVISQSLLLRPDNSVDSSGDFATKNGRTYSSKRTSFNEIRDILSARGAAMMVRRDFYQNVEGFDEDYFISFEDVELGWKAWIMGYRVVMTPTSVVYHDGAATTKKMSSLMTFHGLKNQLSLITTHFETHLATRNMIIILSGLLFGLMKLLVGKTTDPRTISVDKKAALRAIGWYIKNFNVIWQKHRKIEVKRKRSTKELMSIRLITNECR